MPAVVACSSMSTVYIGLGLAALLGTAGGLGLKALLARWQPGRIASKYWLAALTFTESLAYFAIPIGYTELVDLVGPRGLSEPLVATFGIALVVVGSAGLHGMLLDGDGDGGLSEWQQFGWSTLYACAVLASYLALFGAVAIW